MKPSDIVTLLLEDLEFKKHFKYAYSGRGCSGCGNEFDDGEDFIFMGDKQMLCRGCQLSVEEYLKRL